MKDDMMYKKYIYICKSQMCEKKKVKLDKKKFFDFQKIGMMMYKVGVYFCICKWCQVDGIY